MPAFVLPRRTLVVFCMLLAVVVPMQRVILWFRSLRAWFTRPHHSSWSFSFIVALAMLLWGCAGTPVHPESPNTCDLTGSEPGHPSCLPQPGFFCVDPPAESASQVNPSAGYMGQTFSLFPSKESLGSALPICPPNATRLVQEEDLKRVKAGAHEIGRQIGVIITRCERIMEQLTEYPDGTLRHWYTQDQASLGVVLDSCAKELDTIPQVPTFDDPWLAMGAADAFEKGYGAGVDEVSRRLLILELAIDTIELIVLPELLLAEVLFTRALRGSIQALRRMPIFIPGAAGGMGAFLKAAPKAVVTVVVRGSSRALAKAMNLAGKIRLPGEFAHHIVAHGDWRAAEALAVLDRFGIGVDEAINGVFLPAFKTSLNPRGKIIHGNLHTNAYYKAVNLLLKGATTKADVIRALWLIAFKLEHGLMP